MIDRVGNTWRAPDPPPGLAQATITFLEPHWRKKERPVSRQETGLIWSSALAMAGATAAVVLILADRHFPIGHELQIDHLVEVGLKIGAFQVVAGGVISLVLLAIRASRSSETEARRRNDLDGGGRE